MEVFLLSLLLLSAASFNLCALTTDDKSIEHDICLLDFVTGDLTELIALPDLENVGACSAGADYGSYYTIGETVDHESDFFLIDVKGNTSKYVRLVMPPAFSNMTRYGIASLNMDSRSKKALALIVGIDVNWDWYCFLGLLNDKTGGIDQVLADLTNEFRTWTYLYDGITAWDPSTGVYYLSAVIGEHDLTTIMAYNISKPGPQSPIFTIFYPYDDEGEGMFRSLAISPHLAAQGKGSLVALVDDMDGAGVAIWVTSGPKEEVNPQLPVVQSKHSKRIQRGKRPPDKPRKLRSKDTPKRVRDAPAPWSEVIQFEPLTIGNIGWNNMMLDDKGNAFAVFHDDHLPVSNQIVVQVDLVRGSEIGRVSVAGSQMGDAIDYLFQCPP